MNKLLYIINLIILLFSTNNNTKKIHLQRFYMNDMNDYKYKYMYNNHYFYNDYKYENKYLIKQNHIKIYNKALR